VHLVGFIMRITTIKYAEETNSVSQSECVVLEKTDMSDIKGNK